jgi:ribosomal protein L31E
LNEEIQQNNNCIPEIQLGDPEVKSAQVFTTRLSKEFVLLERLNRFSDWSKAVRAIARLQRFIKKTKPESNSTTMKERKDAVKTIIRMVQQETYQEEINQLNSDSGSVTGKEI